jgi:hypothetical protein
MLIKLHCDGLKTFSFGRSTLSARPFWSAVISERRSQQAAEVARVVRKKARLRHRMAIGRFVGGWVEEVEALNTPMDDLERTTTEITRAIGAGAGNCYGPSAQYT